MSPKTNRSLEPGQARIALTVNGSKLDPINVCLVDIVDPHQRCRVFTEDIEQLQEILSKGPMFFDEHPDERVTIIEPRHFVEHPEVDRHVTLNHFYCENSMVYWQQTAATARTDYRKAPVQAISGSNNSQFFSSPVRQHGSVLQIDPDFVKWGLFVGCGEGNPKSAPLPSQLPRLMADFAKTHPESPLHMPNVKVYYEGKFDHPTHFAARKAKLVPISGCSFFYFSHDSFQDHMYAVMKDGTPLIDLLAEYSTAVETLDRVWFSKRVAGLGTHESDEEKIRRASILMDEFTSAISAFNAGCIETAVDQVRTLPTTQWDYRTKRFINASHLGNAVVRTLREANTLDDNEVMQNAMRLWDMPTSEFEGMHLAIALCDLTEQRHLSHKQRFEKSPTPALTVGV